jgi:hypothetical protein
MTDFRIGQIWGGQSLRISQGSILGGARLLILPPVPGSDDQVSGWWYGPPISVTYEEVKLRPYGWRLGRYRMLSLYCCQLDGDESFLFLLWSPHD